VDCQTVGKGAIVESMAVYTEPTDDELNALLNGWGLGAPLAFKGIAEGVQNSNFLLETPEGRFIMTIYEKSVATADLPFYLGATEAAADAGLPAARPVHTVSGETTQTIRGKTCALCTFLSGVSPKRPTAAHARAVGLALAQLHNALRDFPIQKPNDLGPTAWAQMWAGRSGDAEALETGTASAINSDLAAISALWPKDLPRGTIHADLFPDNVLYVGEKVSGLIDFYFACTDFLAYDIAVMLNAWCFEPNGREFDLTKGRALLSGYQSVRTLEPAELDALPLLARGAALRFFLTRLIDWTTDMDGALVKKKDPRDCTSRLAFHRAVRGAGDYGAVV
jgi:homoserine kinase type II